MFLKEYLEKNHIIKKGFAKKVDVSEATIHNIISGRKKPSYKTAQRIVKLTNGEVTFEDLFKERN